MAKRPRHAMPDDVKSALSQKRVATKYTRRPAYQRNDYIGWIEQAKTEETRKKRIHQMTDELRAGDVYMKMSWNGGRKAD